MADKTAVVPDSQSARTTPVMPEPSLAADGRPEITREGKQLEEIFAQVPQKELGQLLMKLKECFSKTENGETIELSMLACSIAGWISATQMNHELGDRIHDEVEHWLHANFSFGKKLVAYFHSSPVEALSLVLRSLPIPRQENSNTNYTVYVSPALTEDDPSYSLTLKEWGCTSVTELAQKEDGTVDMEELNVIVEKDKTEGKIPLLIVASVGSGLTGVCDNINQLVGLCRRHDIWLHLEGPRLARRIIRSLDPSSPKILMQLPDVRSVTMDLALWLGYIGGPVVTIIRPPYQSSDSGSKSESEQETAETDQCVSLINSTWPTYAGAIYYWLMLQNLGCNEIAARLRLRLKLADKMSQELLKLDGLTVLNMKKPDPPKKGESPAELVYKGREILSALGEVLEKEVYKPDPPIPVSVMFRYSGTYTGEDSQQPPLPISRVDILNQWLADSAGRNAPNLFIASVSFRSQAWIRFAPFDVPLKDDESLLMKEFDAFISSMKRQVSALEATNKQRPRLAAVLQQAEFVSSLQFVVLPEWEGLGAVRYSPIDGDTNKWTKRKIDALNIEIVKRLRVTDSAYSLGKATMIMNDTLNDKPEDENKKTQDSLTPCIRFGLVTADADVAHLCSTVCKMGAEIEGEIRELEQMSSVVRRGIQEASRELEQEQITRAYQEGLLRQVPIVGGLLNWWSPPSPAKPMSGRRLNLSSGQLSPTASEKQELLEAMPNSSLTTHEPAAEDSKAPIEESDSDGVVPTAASQA